MPRRNIHLIVGLSVVCLMCAVRTSRHGRVLTFAMNQISHRYLEEIDNRGGQDAAPAEPDSQG